MADVDGFVIVSPRGVSTSAAIFRLCQVRLRQDAPEDFYFCGSQRECVIRPAGCGRGGGIDFGQGLT